LEVVSRQGWKWVTFGALQNYAYFGMIMWWPTTPKFRWYLGNFWVAGLDKCMYEQIHFSACSL